MRIIGEFDLDQIKVTVFSMNERISVKYEYNLLEQTYKFRDGSGIRTVENVKAYSSGDTIQAIKQTFDLMAALRMKGLVNLQKLDNETFDEIL
jgi:hypothetical protein